MGSTVFRNPRALSSALTSLGTLQPRALGFLNTVDPLDTVFNCYLVFTIDLLLPKGFIVVIRKANKKVNIRSSDVCTHCNGITIHQKGFKFDITGMTLVSL